MEDPLISSMRFFSDQQLCYADILSPSEARSTENRSRRAQFPQDLDFSFSGNIRSSFVWKVMEMSYKILSQEKRVTQRELFYKLICDSPDYFSSQLEVNRTIQDVVALLRCSRYSLGIMASSRGLVAGRLLLQEPNQEVVDCSVCGSSGHAISGDLNLLDKLILKTDARYIIVVEKHAIFQRLTEDGFFNQVPSILITAKGYPDIATRLLLHRMSRAFPELPILALVDWYEQLLSLVTEPVTLWLGLRRDDLQFILEESLVPLKPKDLQIAKSLMSSEILPENYKEELTFMVQSGQRAEIEALYCHGYDFLRKFMANKIVQANYI
ncbi:Meiotic recombination protein SPO11-2 [Morus notabilis]|uniref:DNA topoisomerase (ATP-hydrolyzing) n=1 Tax=Morus notabilis TaxID=981085 RepID=W9SZE8_9ROSA|nr:Meiotic recombination protein SPO11-2 [Morus notabilis]